MKADLAVRCGRWLRWLAVGLSVVYVGVFLYVALRRMAYPYQLERIEESMLTTVWRLRHGYPLYGPPSLQWAPFLYAPLFFWLSTALSKVMGVGYAPLRAVSTLSTLGCVGVIYAMVWRETRRRGAAVVAAGFFASLYFVVYGWFDIGRVDSLSVFLFLVAVYATRWMHPVTAAFFWLLACAAKQTFLPLGMVLFLVEWARPRRMIVGMVSLAAMVFAGTAWLNHASGHWFSYYAFGTVGELGYVPWREAVLSLPMDFVNSMSITMVLVGATLLIRPMRWRERVGTFYAIVTIMVAGAAWFVRIHRGASINSTIPMFAWAAVLMGVAIHRLLEAVEESESQGHWKRNSVAGIVWLAASMQLIGHFYLPNWVLGLRKDGPSRQAFIDKVRATPGDVWVVSHSYDGILAGKTEHADMDAYDAVLGRKYGPAVEEFQRAIGERRFSAIVLDRTPDAYYPKGIFTTPPFSEAYPVMVSLPFDWATGVDDKPRYVMLPCSALTAPTTGLIDVRSGVVDRSRCP